MIFKRPDDDDDDFDAAFNGQRPQERFRPIISAVRARTIAAIQAIAAVIEQLPPPVDMNAERDKAWRAARTALREAAAALEEE